VAKIRDGVGEAGVRRGSGGGGCGRGRGSW